MQLGLVGSFLFVHDNLIIPAIKLDNIPSDTLYYVISIIIPRRGSYERSPEAFKMTPSPPLSQNLSGLLGNYSAFYNEACILQ